jgi:hypothetical protein
MAPTDAIFDVISSVSPLRDSRNPKPKLRSAWHDFPRPREELAEDVVHSGELPPIAQHDRRAVEREAGYTRLWSR